MVDLQELSNDLSSAYNTGLQSGVSATALVAIAERLDLIATHLEDISARSTDPTYEGLRVRII